MRGQTGDQTLVQRSLRPVLAGMISGLVLSAVLLLLFSVLISLRDMPQGAIGPMAILSICAGAFLCGFICARLTRRNGLAYGAFCGAVLSLVILAGGMISGAGGIGVPAIFRVVYTLISTMIGGVLGVNARSRRR